MVTETYVRYPCVAILGGVMQLQIFSLQYSRWLQKSSWQYLNTNNHHSIQLNFDCSHIAKQNNSQFPAFSFAFILIALSRTVVKIWTSLIKILSSSNTTASQLFHKVCHHSGGFFIHWAHVTSLTCKPVNQYISHMNELILCIHSKSGLLYYHGQA